LVLDKVATTEAERQKVLKRIIDSGFAKAPEFQGLAPEVGGPFGELDKLDKDQKAVEDWYKDQLTLLGEYRAERADLNAQWDEKERELIKEHNDKILEIEKARQFLQVEGAAFVFGQLGDLAKVFGGEQSTLYKRLFIMQKAATLASVLLSSSDAIAKAWASAPFPANLGAVAITAAKTGALQALASSATLGIAHSGWNSIPETGTYFLKKGERVTTGETSAKLDQTLNEIRRSGMYNRPGISQTINVAGIVDSRTSGQIARDSARKQAQVQQRFG
jgi:hypothetical protein